MLVIPFNILAVTSVKVPPMKFLKSAILTLASAYSATSTAPLLVISMDPVGAISIYASASPSEINDVPKVSETSAIPPHAIEVRFPVSISRIVKAFKALIFILFLTSFSSFINFFFFCPFLPHPGYAWTDPLRDDYHELLC